MIFPLIQLLNSFDSQNKRSDNQILWSHFLEGDEKALSELFETFYLDLYYYGLKISSNREITKDAIQELFLTLWRRKSTINSQVNVQFYLMKSLRRIIWRQDKINKTRYRRNFRYIQDESNIGLPLDSKWIEQENNEEIKTILAASFEKLTPRQKEVLYLRFYGGMNNDEIAQIIDISNQRVRNIIHEAIVSIRVILENNLENAGLA